MGYELKGDLKKKVLQASAQKILEKHQVLRTYFDMGHGLPEVRLQSTLTIDLEIINLTGTDEAEKLALARSQAVAAAQKPFDLIRAPLLRLQLYQLSDTHFLFTITIHHTIADGWSLGLFLKELMSNYRALAAGAEPNTTGVPIQYTDFAHWQTQKVLNKAYADEIRYWTKQLGGPLPVLQLPLDSPRGNRQSFDGETHQFDIPESLTARLTSTVQGENITLFMLLLTVYVILLRRYSGQDDIIVGTPVANRNLPELEPLIGIFINTVALRTTLPGDPAFLDLARHCRDVALEAFDHQQVPFEKLVEVLKPARHLDRPPVFQVGFNLQNAPVPPLELPNIAAAPFLLERNVAQFDINLMITRSATGHVGTVEYNSSHFSRENIENLFEGYLRLLEACANAPGTSISQLRLMSAESEIKLTKELNQTEAAFPAHKGIHQLFEEQVVQSPIAIAASDQQQSLTYKELNHRADRWHHFLRQQNIKSGDRIVLLMGRRVETVAIILGILKVGATYIPIHTETPTERLHYIIKDAEAVLLITDRDEVPGANCQVVRSTEVTLTIQTLSDIVSNTPTPEQLAYVIYTSGSTGRPKGVMIPHRTLTNFLWSMKTKPGLKASDRLLAVTTFSFDIAMLELLLPLIVGATTVIADEAAIQDPFRLAELITAEEITTLQATPALWQMLVNTGRAGKDNLKALVGGDAFPERLAQQLMTRTAELWNMYGPTETTIWSAIKKITDEPRAITIGQPINNTQLYVLDHHLQPAPQGVIGELYIGGTGLAIGYLNNETLTNQQFIKGIPNPEFGDRLYRTGDLARYTADQSIEILGRTDHQVKIDGYRIELGEVSHALSSLPDISEAVTIVRKEKSGQKRMIAYFVLAPGQVLTGVDIQRMLQDKLPNYMRPKLYIQLEALPLNSNGKIDRAALPVPEDVRIAADYIAPRHQTDEVLIQIWQEVLGHEQIGIGDNFFELGGASIQSLQMVAQANMMGYRIKPETIFEFQTVAEISDHLMTDEQQDHTKKTTDS